jgi:hypothetical protein
LLLIALQGGAVLLLQYAHVPVADLPFWSEVPLYTIATPPLAALTVLVYLDASAAVRKRRHN